MVPTGRLLAFNDSGYLAFCERLISKRFDIMRRRLFPVGTVLRLIKYTLSLGKVTKNEWLLKK